MPLFYYRCKACGEVAARVAPIRHEPGPCPKCGGEERERCENAPTSTCMERIDNGFMPKAIERIYDVERMSFERARQKDGS